MMILQESMVVAALAWFLLIAPFDPCYLPGADVTAAGQTYNRIRCTDEKREKKRKIRRLVNITRILLWSAVARMRR